MRFPFRAIGVGLLAGTALFFVPFLFRFILFALIIGFIIRLVTGRRGYGGRWGFIHDHPHSFKNHENDIIPIDGQKYISTINRNIPEQQFFVK